jgi:hypothetical protein
MINFDKASLFRAVAMAACAALVAAACVSGAGASPSNAQNSASPTIGPLATVADGTSGPSNSPDGLTSPGGSPAPSPALVTPAPPSGSMSTTELSEADNGRAVTVSVGATLELVLHNTYWQVSASSKPAVLTMIGQPVYSAAGTMKCVPGTGCGTVTATFKAVAAGAALIAASRTSCGEALLCTGSAGVFEVNVAVVP